MRQVEKCGREIQDTDENTIRIICFEGWINKSTDTHLKYVIITAFPRQRSLREGTLMSRLYVHACLFSIKLRTFRTIRKDLECC